MKNLVYLILFSTFIFAAISCGSDGKNALKTKKEEMAKLKEEKEKLNQKIAKLQTEIDSLDTAALSRSKARLVAVKALEYSTFINYIEIMGRIDADQNSNVSVEMPGTLLRINVTVGQRVSIGQTLGEIDNTVSTVALNELRQQIEFAKTVYEKQKSLWDQKIGTELQYLTAKNNYEALQKKMATMNQQVGLSRIKAPISGVIDDIFVKAGQTVAPGVPCFRIFNASKLKVKADIAESFAGKVKEGNQVELIFPDIQKVSKSQISYCSRVIDQVNRAFKIEIPLPADEDLRPNMLVKIKIIGYMKDQAIVVPVNNVREVNGEYFVIVAEKRNGLNKSAKRKVKPGTTYNGQTEILSGLNSGDMLITAGYQDLEDGDEIKF